MSPSWWWWSHQLCEGCSGGSGGAIWWSVESVGTSGSGEISTWAPQWHRVSGGASVSVTSRLWHCQHITLVTSVTWISCSCVTLVWCHDRSLIAITFWLAIVWYNVNRMPIMSMVFYDLVGRWNCCFASKLRDYSFMLSRDLKWIYLSAIIFIEKNICQHKCFYVFASLEVLDLNRWLYLFSFSLDRIFVFLWLHHFWHKRTTFSSNLSWQ